MMGSLTRMPTILASTAPVRWSGRESLPVAQISDENTRNPDDHDAKRVGDHRQAEGFGTAGGQPVLEQVGKHSDAERDEHVGEEGELMEADLPDAFLLLRRCS